MSNQLSTQEYNEPVTKGFLVDNEYITRRSLEEILDSKNYVTKEYLSQSFDIFEQKIDIKIDIKINALEQRIDERFKKSQEEYFSHLQALMEDYHRRMYSLIELFEARFERMERFVGLA